MDDIEKLLDIYNITIDLSDLLSQAVVLIGKITNRTGELEMIQQSGENSLKEIQNAYIAEMGLIMSIQKANKEVSDSIYDNVIKPTLEIQEIRDKAIEELRKLLHLEDNEND